MWTAEWIEYMIAESTAWLLMGSSYKAHRGFQRAEQSFAILKRKDPALGAKLNRLELTCAMRSYQWATRFKRRRRAERMRREAENAYTAAKRYYEQAGDWDVLQTLEHEALRLKMPERSTYALPVTVGYESVGLRTMAAISARDRIRRRSSEARWFLTDNLQTLAEELIDESARYGRHHEAWKMYWILLLRGRGVGRRTWFLRWLDHFLQVQYQALYRLAQPIAQIVRSGDDKEKGYLEPRTLECGRSGCPQV
jgi:hypothetical protein